MKKLMLLVAIFGALSCIKTSSSCSKEINASPCIDMSGVDTSAMCAEIYDPVCGCDKVTYGNECEATQKGVQSWIEGECCP